MKSQFSILFLFITVMANGQSLKTFSINEQLEDIEFIKTALEELHPGIFSFQTKQEFDTGFETLKESLEVNQTVFEFYNKLVPVINQIGCGHTTSKIPSKELKRIQKARQYLPIEIKIIDNKIFITKVLVENKALFPGLEILSIDGLTTAEFIKSNLNRYPSDGKIMSRKYQSMEKNFSIDLSRFHYTSENFKIEVDLKGARKTLTIAGINYKEFILKTNPAKLDALELTIVDSISTAIMTIRNSRSKKLFDAFLEHSFAQIQLNKITNLIIDVRYDSFNRDSDGADLFSYLTNEPFRYYDKLKVTKNYDVPKAISWFTHYPIEKDSSGAYYWKIHPQLELQTPKPRPYLGKVFVLTNGFTFSATSEFSSVIKSSGRGRIIGRETGGSYYGNNSGGMLRKVLPNSKLVVYVPPIHYMLAVNNLGEFSKGVIPDIPVSESIKNTVLNIDRTMETAVNLIQVD